MGGRAQTWPAGKAPNTRVQTYIFLLLTYNIQRCVLPLSFSFLCLCFVVFLCCTLTRIPQSPGVCQQKLVLAHIATGSDHNNNAEEISFYLLQEKTGVPTEDCTNWCVPSPLPHPLSPPFSFLPPSLSHPTYSPSSSKTTCTFFLIPLSGLTVTIFSGGVSRREGCTSGERKGEEERAWFA